MFHRILNSSNPLGSRLVRAISSVCLAWRIIFATALVASCTAPLQAQTTATVTPVAYAQQSNGALQAGDGNFYTTSPPILQTCNNDPNSLCSYVYKMTPAGLTSIVHTFGPVPTSGTNLNNTDGLGPTALIVGTDGNLYGACRYGGSAGVGTIFEIMLTTGDFQVLKDFNSTPPAVWLSATRPSILFRAMTGISISPTESEYTS